MKRYRYLLLAQLFVLAVLAGSISGAAVDGRVISVSGHCIKKVSPDRGTVTLVAQFRDKSAAVASSKAMQTYEKVRKAVVELKLKDVELQTSEYVVQEDFDYQGNKKVSKGMRASLGLQITTSEISRLGEVTALTSRFEINRVENLLTLLSGEKSKLMHESCLVEAITNARDKAEKMAQSAGARVGDVQLIDENPARAAEGVESYGAAMGAMRDESSASAAKLSPTIESKPEMVSVNVLVKFALK